MNHPRRTFALTFLLVALVVTAVWVATARDGTELATPARPVADAEPEPARPEPPPPAADETEKADVLAPASPEPAGEAGAASGEEAEAGAPEPDESKPSRSGPPLPPGAKPYEPEKAGPRKVAGSVEDADRGDAIGSALVTFKEVRPEGGPRHVAVFRTDEEGRFAAEGLKEAVYEVTVVALGKSATPRYSNYETKLDLTTGDLDSLRVQMKPVNTTLRVRIEDASGSPVAAPGMIAFRRPGADGYAGQGVTLDAAGEGTIVLRVEPGEWEVGWWPRGASAPGHWAKTTIYAGANGPLLLRLPE